MKSKWDIEVTDRHCPVCDDTGWVCEAHPNGPWANVSDRWDACVCGAPGVPCHSCNRTKERERPEGELRTAIVETFKEIDSECNALEPIGRFCEQSTD